MKNLLKQVTDILKKIEDNTIDMWEANLEETKSVAILEDCLRGIDDEERAPYNGWLEDLLKLKKEIAKHIKDEPSQRLEIHRS